MVVVAIDTLIFKWSCAITACLMTGAAGLFYYNNFIVAVIVESECAFLTPLADVQGRITIIFIVSCIMAVVFLWTKARSTRIMARFTLLICIVAIHRYVITFYTFIFTMFKISCSVITRITVIIVGSKTRFTI